MTRPPCAGTNKFNEPCRFKACEGSDFCRYHGEHKNENPSKARARRACEEAKRERLAFDPSEWTRVDEGYPAWRQVVEIRNERGGTVKGCQYVTSPNQPPYWLSPRGEKLTKFEVVMWRAVA